ncbi:hypothetical protein GCM10017687_77220 [Streptomyces echinatus]
MPSPSGQPHVEHGYVRAEGGAAGQCVLGGVGVADDADVRFGVEQVGQAASYHLVVVQQEHPDGVLLREAARLGHDGLSFPGYGQTAACPRRLIIHPRAPGALGPTGPTDSMVVGCETGPHVGRPVAGPPESHAAVGRGTGPGRRAVRVSQRG